MCRSPTTGFEPGADVRSIVPFHGQLFAAGWVTAFQRGNPNALLALVRRSPLGAHRADAVRRGQRRTARRDTRRLLTFGQASSHDGRGPTSIWRSTDGLSWQLVTSSAPWGIRMIVAAPAGLVAAGVDDASGCGSPPLACTSSAIWSSGDGSTWTKAEGGASLFPRGSVVGVVRAGRGLVAVGFRRDGVTKHTTATIVWTSPDGANLAPPTGPGDRAGSGSIPRALPPAPTVCCSRASSHRANRRHRRRHSRRRRRALQPASPPRSAA